MPGPSRWLIFFGLLIRLLPAWADPVDLTGVNYASNQALFQLSAPCKAHYFILTNPNRLVVDFANTRLPRDLPQPVNHPLFSRLRVGVHAADLRVVLHLTTEAGGKMSQTAKDGGMDFTFDLTPKTPPAAAPAVAPEAAFAVKPVVAQAARKPSAPPAAKKGRDIVVAIDAGHGGKDVGAQGAGGAREKDVVFAIARRLQQLVDAQPGMRAVMIRDGDYFVHLPERVRLAQEAKADLLLSIHADAFMDASAHGASVYTLANRGASSAGARWLADSENAADGDSSVSDASPLLANVLQDLTNKASKEASQNAGAHVLRRVGSLSGVHREAVQKAGFVVLKSGDIPSILVETAFISNPLEEQRLLSRAYQDKMAAAIFGGVLAHFRQYAPGDTLFARLSGAAKPALAVKSTPTAPAAEENKPIMQAVAPAQQHVISRGDTLLGIAQQYKVSMRALRLANNMPDGNLRVGQVLQIPRDG